MKIEGRRLRALNFNFSENENKFEIRRSRNLPMGAAPHLTIISIITFQKEQEKYQKQNTWKMTSFLLDLPQIDRRFIGL